jgi:thiopurine S-methyltransferase
LVGDVFALSAPDLANIQYIYDRAALIALPPSMRQAYAGLLTRLLPQASQLLITLEYPQEQMSGPPFSVLPDELTHLYPEREIRLLERHDILAHEPRFAARGVTSLHETVWQLSVARESEQRVAHD